jgi:hypothetical protein
MRDCGKAIIDLGSVVDHQALMVRIANKAADLPFGGGHVNASWVFIIYRSPEITVGIGRG